MSVFLVTIAVASPTLCTVFLLVALWRFSTQTREERERYVRAIMSKNIPEFGTIQKIIEGDVSGEARRLRAVHSNEPHRDPDMPAVPEGL